MLTARTFVPCSRIFTEKFRHIKTIAPATKFHTQNAPNNYAATWALQRKTFTSTADSPKADLTQQQRIYYGSLAPRMSAVKIFSLTTSLAGIAAQPILLEQGMKIGGTGIAIFICSFAGFFTFVTPLLLHFITKKYVTEIHYNEATEEYTATTISFILRKIHTKFRPSDVTVPDIPGMFTSFLVGKKALFVDPTLFKDTEHYIKIMGYDKPVDFKLDLKEPPAVHETNNKKKE